MAKSFTATWQTPDCLGGGDKHPPRSYEFIMSTNFQTTKSDAKSADFLLRVIFRATSCQTAANCGTTRTGSTAMLSTNLQRLQKGGLVSQEVSNTFCHQRR